MGGPEPQEYWAVTGDGVGDCGGFAGADVEDLDIVNAGGGRIGVGWRIGSFGRTIAATARRRRE